MRLIVAKLLKKFEDTLDLNQISDRRYATLILCGKWSLLKLLYTNITYLIYVVIFTLDYGVIILNNGCCMLYFQHTYATPKFLF